MKMPGFPVRGHQAGSALIAAIFIGLLLAGVGAGLVAVSSAETHIAAAFRSSHEISLAAESAFERALLDLDRLADWDAVLLPAPAGARATFDDGSGLPRAPDGRVLDVAALTGIRQAESDARDGPAAFGADTPRWRLFGHASLASLLPPSTPAPPAHVLVWIADDGWDGDGNASADANDRLLVFARAYGTAGGRHAVEGVVSRSADGMLWVLSRRMIP